MAKQKASYTRSAKILSFRRTSRVRRNDRIFAATTQMKNFYDAIIFYVLYFTFYVKNPLSVKGSSRTFFAAGVKRSDRFIWKALILVRSQSLTIALTFANTSLTTASDAQSKILQTRCGMF